MIEIKNLYKRYHNHHGSDWVLKDINLTIPKGVSVGLIGANGAGKSTLLRLIAGMDTPDRGEVIRHSRVSWPVGLAGGMQNNMTGRQNVKFVARSQGADSSEVKRVIEFVQDFAEIGKAFDEPVRTYSSGMRARLSFGLSLSFDFDVYISDEATAVGDRAFKAKAQALFKDKVGKASLIMVSHSEGILRNLCQVGVYIKAGEAHFYEDINNAIADYHNDVDHLRNRKCEEKKTSITVADNLNEEKKNRQTLKKLKAELNGLVLVLKKAKREGWEAREITSLNRMRVALLNEIESMESDVITKDDITISAIKKTISKHYKSIAAVDSLIHSVNLNFVNHQDLSVLSKALEVLKKEVSEEEKTLKDLNGHG